MTNKLALNNFSFFQLHRKSVTLINIVVNCHEKPLFFQTCRTGDKCSGGLLKQIDFFQRQTFRKIQLTGNNASMKLTFNVKSFGLCQFSFDNWCILRQHSFTYWSNSKGQDLHFVLSVNSLLLKAIYHQVSSNLFPVSGLSWLVYS